MKFADEYLAKQQGQESLIKSYPAKELKHIAVIPAYNESGLVKCLDSLFSSERPKFPAEVITVINWPHKSPEDVINRNIEIKRVAEEWAESRNSESFSFHFIVSESLSEKKSGVGWARKTGMDEAIRRFRQVKSREGIIFSLDADVEINNNYFVEIERHFERLPDTGGCTIYFEHPLEKAGDNLIREGIIQYELHQRYYIQSLRYAGHPNVFHTVGSAFAVKAESYCLQGGMNIRKAGEDFYFLQKLFDLGNFTECNETIVYPSPRPSDRVPFGTGPVISDYINNRKELLSFSPELFDILKEWLCIHDELYDSVRRNDFSFLDRLNPLMREFLEKNEIEKRLKEIYENSSNNLAFSKRFYRWFNMFRMLKFLNFGKSVFPDLPVREATAELLKKKNIEAGSLDSESLLIKMREIESRKRVNHPPQQ